MDDLFDIVEDETLSLDDSNNDDKNKEETKEEKNDTKPKKSMLEKYGENLTTKVYVTNPAIAREDEIEKTILTILTPEKSAILVGKAGIGKTAIVEGIAYKIQRDDVPNAIKGYDIIKVNTSSLLGKYETEDGTEELRINILLKEVEKAKNVILFIDEIHTLVIESRNSGIDFVNAMKPALSRGDVKVIGATTLDEYNQYLIRDKAFLRRFEKIDVQEPDAKTTVKILMGSYPRIEKQTGVKLAYSQFVIEKLMTFIVDMTSEYKRVYELGSRYPDNALALLSKAFSYAKFDNSPFVTFKHFYKAIMNCQSVYSNVVKEESEKFKKEFKEFLEKENVDLNDY
ncbi:MAG TPA: ATP-dependent Clp protease ATP-binding subunit [Candidatus Aphodocola excrementigallinarum]|uniref:ATP-dependent Clp protease ATP-binding subunit n=1 Tax=Candidatus Aphodocola excrementigallinarum TaxID=2840670 RepID=A0A9D1INY2_9FIRM|nr:ATP-dependent Clp protease ATP-binding subunit [Candidatus Aphodocola excrementigallinarum]